MASKKNTGSGLVFYESYYEAVRELDDADRLSMYDAILAFGFTGEVAPLPKHLKPLLTLIMPNITASKERHEAAVANGRKGGAPPGNQNARKNNPSTTGQTIEKQPKNNLDMDIDTERDTDTDSDSEADTASDMGITINMNSIEENELSYTPLTAEEEAATRDHWIACLEQRRQREKP